MIGIIIFNREYMNFAVHVSCLKKLYKNSYEKRKKLSGMKLTNQSSNILNFYILFFNVILYNIFFFTNQIITVYIFFISCM